MIELEMPHPQYYFEIEDTLISTVNAKQGKEFSILKFIYLILSNFF